MELSAAVGYTTRVPTQLIITGDPAVRHLIPPRVKHLQALLVAGLILELFRNKR